jgi:hypothetical protein
MVCNINQSFVLDCRDNVGGIKEVKIKTYSSALVGIAVTSGQATLSGQGLTGWYKLECEEATATASDNGTTSRENGTTMYAPTVNYVYNGKTAAFLNELQKYHGGTFEVAVKYNNGAIRLFGYENGLFCSASVDESGTTYGDRNGYTVTFTGMEKVKAPHITNNWDVLVSA